MHFHLPTTAWGWLGAALRLDLIDGTGISWCDLTFNPWMGCTKVSPGCKHCYAASLVTGRMGLQVWGPGVPRQLTKGPWHDVARWGALAAGAQVELRVFMGSLCDFADDDPGVPAGARAAAWAVVRANPWLTFLVVTKRGHLLPQYLPTDWGDGYPNVWLIHSVCTVDEVYSVVPSWRHVPAVVHGLSLEPQLADLAPALDDVLARPARYPIDWLITGGESGATDVCAPYLLSWGDHLVDLGARRGVKVWFKQAGSVTARQLGWRAAKGDDPAEWPASLRVQQHPLPRRYGRAQVSL